MAYTVQDPINTTYQSVREPELFPTELPPGIATGSTYDRILQAAWSPSEPDNVDKKVWAQLSGKLTDTIADYKSSTNKELSKQRMSILKARIDLQANQKEMIQALHQVAGGDRQAGMAAMARVQTKLFEDMTYLSKTNNQVIEQYYSEARRKAADAGGDKLVGLQWVFGSLESDGMLMEGSTDLPMIMQRLREDFADNDWNSIPNQSLRETALRLQARADAQRHQHEQMRQWLDESYKGMTGAINELATGHTMTGQPVNMPETLRKAEKYLSDIDAAVGTVSGLDVDEASQQLEQMVKDDKFYEDATKNLQRVNEKLFSDDQKGADYRTKMAKIIGTPKYQAWAADHGLTIGTVQLDEQGNVVSYVPGKDDAFSLVLAGWEMTHPDMKIHGKNTREWVKVQRVIPGSDKPLDVPRPVDGQAAFVTDPDGNRQYLDANQLSALADANNVSRFEVGAAFYPSAGTGGQPVQLYVMRDKITGKVYVDSGSGNAGVPNGGWVEAGDPSAASYVKQWMTAVVQNDDGTYRVAKVSDLDKPAVNVQAADDDEMSKIFLKPPSKIEDVVSLTPNPTSGPRYETVYGKRRSMMANDELGSIRVLTNNGEVYIPPSEIGNKEVVAKGTNTSLADVFTRAVGRRQRERAIRYDDTTPSPTPVTNVLDKFSGPSLRQSTDDLNRTLDNNRRQASINAVAGTAAPMPPPTVPAGMDAEVSRLMIDRPPVTAEQVRAAREGRPAGMPHMDSSGKFNPATTSAATPTSTPAPMPTSTPAVVTPTSSTSTPARIVLEDTVVSPSADRRAAVDEFARKVAEAAGLKPSTQPSQTTPTTPPVKINTADLEAQRRKLQEKLAAKKKAEEDAKAAKEAIDATGVTSQQVWKPTLPADLSARQRQEALEYARRVNEAATVK